MTSSFMSAITLLGTPAEVYQFGTMYWLVVLAFFLVMPATNYLYMPIFYELQVTSAYEVIRAMISNAKTAYNSIILVPIAVPRVTL